MTRKDPFGNILHARMYYKHGAYWYVYQGKWQRLAKQYPAAMQAYTAKVSPTGGMGKLVHDTYASLERRVERGDLSSRSLKQYSLCREHIEAAFQEFAPSQVKPSHIAAFLDFHYEGQPSYGNLSLTVLRTVFDKGVRWGQCDYNPAKQVDRFVDNKRDRYLTDAEFMKIRGEASEWLRQIIDMCYLTAQRIGDVLYIKQSDIAEDGIHFRQQKTKKRQIVEATPELLQLVKDARALSKVAGVYLFGRTHSHPRDYSTVRRNWNKACKAAGVEDAVIHDLRAKALTDADAEGQDAQKLAGHSNRSTTERYLRLLRTDRVQSPGRVSSLLGRKR